MRHELRMAALTALLALAACGKGAPEADKKEEAKGEGPGITLTAEQSEGLGLQTAKLVAASHRGQLTGYGMVMAIDAIAQSDADTASAEAAAAQSQAAAARARDLSTGEDAAVSRETYEVAAAKAATDQTAVLLARRKADAAFGPDAPWRTPAQRAAILPRLQSGRSVLVKVTFPIGANVTPQRFNIARMGVNGKSWSTGAVWNAPADATIPGRSLFALVDGSDLAQGERVIATIPTGAPQAGVLVPHTALVMGESDSWAYLKTKENTYLRTRIDTTQPDGDGYFVAEGLKPGQEVVTTGAGQLYAREVNPSTEPAD
jgi:membrane fusion protein, multidrug efflux system